MSIWEHVIWGTEFENYQKSRIQDGSRNVIEFQSNPSNLKIESIEFLLAQTLD